MTAAAPTVAEIQDAETSADACRVGLARLEALRNEAGAITKAIYDRGERGVAVAAHKGVTDFATALILAERAAPDVNFRFTVHPDDYRGARV